MRTEECPRRTDTLSIDTPFSSSDTAKVSRKRCECASLTLASSKTASRYLDQFARAVWGFAFSIRSVRDLFFSGLQPKPGGSLNRYGCVAKRTCNLAFARSCWASDFRISDSPTRGQPLMSAWRSGGSSGMTLRRQGSTKLSLTCGARKSPRAKIVRPDGSAITVSPTVHTSGSARE